MLRTKHDVLFVYYLLVLILYFPSKKLFLINLSSIYALYTHIYTDISWQPRLSSVCPAGPAKPLAGAHFSHIF